MSDWAEAKDYATLEEVFGSPDFGHPAAPEVIVPPVTAAAAMARRLRRAQLLRDRTIASVCGVGAAVSVAAALIIGSGPVSVPVLSGALPLAPANVPSFPNSGNTGSGGGSAAPGNAASGAAAGGLAGPALTSLGAGGSTSGAAALPTHAQTVSFNPPASTTTTTTTTTPAPVPAPAPSSTTTSPTTPPTSTGTQGAQGTGRGGGNGNGGSRGNGGGGTTIAGGVTGNGGGQGNGNGQGDGNDNGNGGGQIGARPGPPLGGPQSGPPAQEEGGPVRGGRH